MRSLSSVSSAEIKEGLRIAAGLIDDGHESLWPLFERLERELEAHDSKAERLAKYR